LSRWIYPWGCPGGSVQKEFVCGRSNEGIKRKEAQRPANPKVQSQTHRQADGATGMHGASFAYIGWWMHKIRYSENIPVSQICSRYNLRNFRQIRISWVLDREYDKNILANFFSASQCTYLVLANLLHPRPPRWSYQGPCCDCLVMSHAGS